MTRRAEAAPRYFRHGVASGDPRPHSVVLWTRLAPEPLQVAEGWLARQRTLWERRLDQFDDYVTSLKETP
jgi:phosphodiesterase/alkaline phosphatase D-like protein